MNETPTIGIYVPTLKRGDRLADVAKNIHDNTSLPHKIYFVVEPDDIDSQEKGRATGEEVVISEHPGFHTGAVTTIYNKTNEPYFIMANDDFNFHQDWDINAMAKMVPPIQVVGLNELSPNQVCNTIFLIDRNYIKEQSAVIDEPNTVFHTGYKHNYADTELWATAMRRGVAVTCPESVVEHMHPGLGKGVRDATYGHSDQTAGADQALYNSRKHLWE